MPEPPLAPALRPFDAVGAWTIALVDSLGRFRAFVDRINFIGYRSLLIIFLTGAFTGMVLGLQIYLTLSRFGSEAFLGPAVALSLIRELGPVLAALMVTGRAGSALTAELGIMRITEQIDALTAFAVNPVQYLVSPRLLAGVIMAPLMTMIFNLVGVFGGYLVAVGLENVDSAQFFYTMTWYTDPSDIWQGLFKAGVFGLTLTLVGSYQGFYASGGAKGVGLATTRAVVVSSVLILCLDYFLGDVLLVVLSK